MQTVYTYKELLLLSACLSSGFLSYKESWRSCFKEKRTCTDLWQPAKNQIDSGNEHSLICREAFSRRSLLLWSAAAGDECFSTAWCSEKQTQCLLRSQAEPAQGLLSTYTESAWMPKDETAGTSCSHHGERRGPGMKSCGTRSPSCMANGRGAEAVVWGGASHSSPGLTSLGQGFGTGPGRQLSYCPQQPPHPGQLPPLLYQKLALQVWFRWQSWRISVQLWGYPFPSVLSVLFTWWSCCTLFMPPNPAGERSYKPQLPKKWVRSV